MASTTQHDSNELPPPITLGDYTKVDLSPNDFYGFEEVTAAKYTSYYDLTSSYLWPCTKKALWKGGRVVARLAGKSNEFLAIQHLLGERSAESEVAFEEVITEHTPDLVAQISKLISTHVGKFISRKAVCSIIPFGFKTAAGVATDKITDSIIESTGLNLDDIFKDVVDTTNVANFLKKAIPELTSTAFNIGSSYLKPIEISNPSVLDDIDFIDPTSVRAVRAKELSEIKIAYLEASALKHFAEIIGPQIEELIKNYLVETKSAVGTLAIGVTALTVRSTIENMIKTKNYTAVSADTKIKNAVTIMEKRFKQTIALDNIMKEFSYQKQFPHKDFKQVPIICNPLSKCRLIKLRKKYMLAQTTLKDIKNELEKILESKDINNIPYDFNLYSVQAQEIIENLVTATLDVKNRINNPDLIKSLIPEWKNQTTTVHRNIMKLVRLLKEKEEQSYVKVELDFFKKKTKHGSFSAIGNFLKRFSTLGLFK